MRTSRFPTQILLVAFATSLVAQQPPYDVFPPAEPPYYRVRYEGSTQPGELVFPVTRLPCDGREHRGLEVPAGGRHAGGYSNAAYTTARPSAGSVTRASSSPRTGVATSE